MKKKVLIFILCLFIFTIGSSSFAKDAYVFKVTKPDQDIYFTIDETLFINGSAPKNANVEIKHYLKDISFKDFESYKDKYPKLDDFKKHFEEEVIKDDGYEELSKTSISVGSLGIFSKKLSLMNGLNKIVVSTAKSEKVFYIYLTDTDKLSESITLMKTIDLIKNLR